MSAAFISIFVIGLAQPAAAQSPLDLFGGAGPCRPSPDWREKLHNTPEGQAWKAVVVAQLQERAPRLGLGPGVTRVTFHVDSRGRVSNVQLVNSESNAHSLVALTVISSLRLPPPPPLGPGCCDFGQTFNFH